MSDNVFRTDHIQDLCGRTFALGLILGLDGLNYIIVDYGRRYCGY